MLSTSDGPQLIHEHSKPQARNIYTLLDYFSALRLLMGTYTYCGSHTVESRVRKGETVCFFDWGSALGYCDDRCTEPSRSTSQRT